MLSFVHLTGNHGDHRPSASLHADDGGRWRLTGELDIAVVDEFELALAAIPADHDVDLGLDGCRFIDVAGARALISLARRLGPDHRLIVHEPPNVLRRLLDLGCPEPDADLVTIT